MAAKASFTCPSKGSEHRRAFPLRPPVTAISGSTARSNPRRYFRCASAASSLTIASSCPRRVASPGYSPQNAWTTVPTITLRGGLSFLRAGGRPVSRTPSGNQASAAAALRVIRPIPFSTPRGVSPCRKRCRYGTPSRSSGRPPRHRPPACGCGCSRASWRRAAPVLEPT